MSQGFPKRWTIIIAFVLSEMSFFKESIQIVKSFRLISARTSLYPPLITASAGDKKVKLGTIISAFLGKSKLSKAISSASVPFATPRQYLLLLNFANFSSNLSTFSSYETRLLNKLINSFHNL